MYTSNLSEVMRAQVELTSGSPATDKFIVKYRQNYYDLTDFLKKHPGGVNTLKGFKDADMTERFLHAPPHSDAALYLMKEFQITAGERKATKFQEEPQNCALYRTNGNEAAMCENRENGLDLVREEDKNNNQMQLDDRIEYLVDWSQALLPQIPKIAPYYDDWVHKPVNRPLRLFRNSYLEMCTKTPWWLIPIFWIPLIIASIFHELHTAIQTGSLSAVLFLAFMFSLGILLWTIIEYSLHRFVFHMKLGPKSHPWLCTFHFLIHGLHHKVPFDPYRLVFPPLAGAIIATIIYAPIHQLLPYPRLFLGGGLFGYLCYDLMHYYLHYGNPKPGHLYHMKRYHNQHHFAHQNMGYGISSPLWDFVFSTRIRLRKLKYQLRWD